MNENVSDADLERFLRGRERISIEYAALGSEQPAPELDALVLERARAALGEDAGRAGWRRRRWPTITALAATVVLSFAVIVRMALDNGQSSLISTTAPSATIPTPAEQPAAAAAADSAEADVEDFAEPPAALADHRQADHARADDASADVPASTAELPRAQIEAEIRATTERAPLASTPGAAAKARAAANQATDRTRSLQVSESAAAAPAPAPAGDTAAAGLREPRAWLEEIERLRAAGHDEEAAREMQSFLEAYPDYPLSRDVESARPASRPPTK